MGSPQRIKIKGAPAYYHIISHTVWEADRALSKWEKEAFISLIEKLTRGYLVEIISYAVLSNHFHLLLRTFPSAELKDEEIMERAGRIFGKLSIASKGPAYWRAKLEDISHFVKDLKQRYSQWYNKRKGRKGHLWSERFKSILIQDGKAALAVAAYIDLNPVRAGLSKTLSSYRHSSYTARLSGQGWLVPLSELMEGLTLKNYKEILEEVGAQEREGKASLKKKEGKGEETIAALRYRAEGLVFGGLGFVEKYGARLRKRKKAGKITEGLYIV